MNLKTLGLDLLCSRQALLIVTIFFVSYSSVAQTFKEDWESGRLRRPPWFEEGYSNTVSNRHSNSGRYSFKSELPARWHGNPRSEIAFGGGSGVPQYQDQFTQWGMSFSIYVPSDFKEDPVKQSILQLKDIMDGCDRFGGNPPFKIGMNGSRFDATVRWTSQKCATSPLGLKYFNRVLNVQPGKWHYFVLNVGWDYRNNGNGYVHLYAKVGSPPSGKDRVINYNGPTGYNDNKGHYLKLGIYKWLWKDFSQVTKSRRAGVVSSVLYYDDIEIRKGRIPMATNKNPTANAGKDQTIELPDSDLTLYGSASDPDNNLGTYDWYQVSGPSNATINQEHTLTPVLKDLREGIYIIRLIVKDKEGATDSDDVKITVKPKVNEAPTANAGPSMETTLPDDKVAFDGDGWDKDGSIVKYQWKQRSGPSNATLTNEDTDDLVVSDLVEGSYVFELTVTDNDGATHKDAMQLTVHKAVNKAPTADAGSNLDITLPKNQVTINGKSWDDGKITKQRWKQTSGPSTATLSGETTNDLTASDLQEGAYVFEFTVTDDAGATDKDAMQVVVNPAVNKAPAADAGSNKDITLPKNQITINATAHDSDGKITKRRWKQRSGPSTATLSGETTDDLTASNLQEGAYVFEFTVTDDAGATHTDAMQVIVNPKPNQAPTADAGPNKSLTLPKNSLTITGTSGDPEGKISKHLWTMVSGPSTAQLSGNNTKELKVSNLVQGKYTFKFTVTDDQGLTAEDAMQVTVHAEAINQAPSADAGPNKVVKLPTSQVALKGTGTDSDGTISSYQWKQLSGPTTASLVGASTPDLTVKDLKAGKYVMSLTVTDNGGATSDDQVTITVKAEEVTVAVEEEVVEEEVVEEEVTVEEEVVVEVDPDPAPEPLTASANITDATCTANNGAVSLQIKGGVGPYTYDWSTGSSAKNLKNLAPGDYQVKITDSQGSELSKTFTVDQVTADLKVDAQITNATCSNKNGAIKVQASGGTGPYNFEWSSKARTSSLTRLSSGYYDLTVSDQNGCSKKVSFNVGMDAGATTFDLDSETTNASCLGNDGSISLKVNESDGPYSFVWDHGATGASLSDLKDGKYSVTITDTHGCFMKKEYTINQTPGPAKPTILQAGDSLYIVQQAASYQWFKDSVAIIGGNRQAVHISEAGTYSVEISNDNTCIVSSDYFQSREPILPLGTNGTFYQVEFYPVPVQNEINYRITLNEPAATTVTIYDFTGKVLLTRELGVVRSFATEALPFAEYPTGAYLIRAKANNEIVTRRFIKY